MSNLNQTKAQRLRRVFRANMLLGAGVFAVSVYLIVTGQYENLAARLATEVVLDRFAIGGLLYIVAFWYLEMFSIPMLFPGRQR
ncbi:MAG TPA: hypothetical protein VGA00_04440 [Acidiferrobacterales bacterium]|jgi:hypothetical protein